MVLQYIDKACRLFDYFRLEWPKFGPTLTEMKLVKIDTKSFWHGGLLVRYKSWQFSWFPKINRLFSTLWCNILIPRELLTLASSFERLNTIFWHLCMPKYINLWIWIIYRNIKYHIWFVKDDFTCVQEHDVFFSTYLWNGFDY